MPQLSAARMDQSRTKKYRDLNIQVFILSYKRRLLVFRPGLVWHYLKSIRDSDAVDLSPSSRRAAILRLSLSPRVLLELLPLQRHSKQQGRTGKTQKGFFSNHCSLLKTACQKSHTILWFISQWPESHHMILPCWKGGWKISQNWLAFCWDATKGELMNWYLISQYQESLPYTN